MQNIGRLRKMMCNGWVVKSSYRFAGSTGTFSRVETNAASSPRKQFAEGSQLVHRACVEINAQLNEFLQIGWKFLRRQGY